MQLTRKQVSTCTALSVALFVILGAVIYSNTFNVPFYFDDENNVLQQALKIDEMSFEKLENAFSGGLLKLRPVSNLSFALNYFIGGERVQGYHLVNIAIHIANGILLYFLLRVTLSLPANRAKYRNPCLLALVSALLWLVHPLGTQSVTYIVQRMNSMATMFYILSLLLYIVGRRHSFDKRISEYPVSSWLIFFGSVASGLLAVMSKEIAATLPMIIFLYEFFFIQNFSWMWLRRKLFWLTAGIFSFFFIAYKYTGTAPWLYFISDCPTRTYTAIERLLTQFRVVVHYIWLLLFPFPGNLAFDYDFPVSTSIFVPVTTLYSLLFLCALFLLALVLAHRERLLSFCLLWFFCNLVIESSVICLEIIFEHRTYMPSMFFVLFCVALFYRLLPWKPVVWLGAFATIALFSVWTYQRNTIWTVPEVFWADSIQKYPKKARIYTNAGNVYHLKGEIDTAEKFYRKALLLSPGHPAANRNLASIFLQRGDLDVAEKHLVKALEGYPGFIEARLDLVTVLEKRGNYEGAIEQCEKVLRIASDSYDATRKMGMLYVRSGDLDEGVNYLHRLLEKHPGDTDARMFLGEAFFKLHRLDDAVAQFKNVIAHDSTFVQAYLNAAKILTIQGDYEAAVELLQYAVALDTSSITTWYDLGNGLLSLNKIDEAEVAYKKAIRMIPSSDNIWNNLGLVYIQKEQYQDALQSFSNAIRYNPKNVSAKNNLELTQELLEKK